MLAFFELEVRMKLALTTAVAALVLAGCASPPTAPSSPPTGYEQQMKTMQEMHQKMAAAKTPEERAALMRDHMKTMQDGMAMMGQMRGMMGSGMMGGGMGAGKGPGGPGMPMDADMMKRRMDMMDMMMQMMMDREGMKPPAAK